MTTLVVMSSWLFAPMTAYAASYDVTASVDFPAPAQAAVINGGIDGTTVQNANLVVSGTCEALTPNGAVSIWRNGVAIGSAPCNGTFSVTVTLQSGVNTLVARSASVSGLYGPDSTPISVTLKLPVPLPAPTPTPANPTIVDNTSQNAGAASNLTATPSQAFSTLNESESIILMVVVVGGSTPYTIHINWGDGSEESKVVDKPGTYQFAHTYAKDGAYTVKGVVRDVLGATTTFHYAVVSQKAAPKSAEQPVSTSQATTTGTNSSNPLWWPLVYTLIGALIAFFGYRVGVMKGSRLSAQPEEPAPTPTVVPPKKRRP